MSYKEDYRGASHCSPLGSNRKPPKASNWASLHVLSCPTGTHRHQSCGGADHSSSLVADRAMSINRSRKAIGVALASRLLKRGRWTLVRCSQLVVAMGSGSVQSSKGGSSTPCAYSHVRLRALCP